MTRTDATAAKLSKVESGQSLPSATRLSLLRIIVDIIVNSCHIKVRTLNIAYLEYLNGECKILQNKVV